MTLDEYQELAQRTSSTATRSDKLENGILGLNGEAGERADSLKKYLYQGHEMDYDHMAEEIGDCLWYCAEAAAGIGLTLGEIGQRNVAKLRARYPDGFDPERSMHREEGDQ